MRTLGGVARARRVALATVLLAAACSSQSSILESGEGEPPTTRAPTTTEPPIDEAAVRDAVETQVNEAQVVVDRLYQEPELVENFDDPLVQGLVSYHTADSARVEAMLEELEDFADDDMRYELHRDTSLTRSHVIAYDIEVLDAETAQFKFCVAMDFVILDSDDEVADEVAQLEIGDGEARLVGGEWLIHAWEEDDAVGLAPGNVLPRECGLYGFGE